MKIVTAVDTTPPVRVGMVYRSRGGVSARERRIMILLSITKTGVCLFIIVGPDGEPTGVSSHSMHYVSGLRPIGHCPELEDLVLTVHPLE